MKRESAGGGEGIDGYSGLFHFDTAEMFYNLSIYHLFYYFSSLFILSSSKPSYLRCESSSFDKIRLKDLHTTISSNHTCIVRLCVCCYYTLVPYACVPQYYPRLYCLKPWIHYAILEAIAIFLSSQAVG